MQRRILLLLCLVTMSIYSLQAQEKIKAFSTKRVLMRVDGNPEVLAGNTSALVMGSYALAPDVTKKLCHVHTLELAIDRIRHTDWKAEPWTQENADLTIRQRMDDYIQTAKEFYTGVGKRPQGVIGRRLEKYTDLELGDRQLASAITSVRMAAAWDVDLQPGQADKLDAVIRLRLSLLDDVTMP